LNPEALTKTILAEVNRLTSEVMPGVQRDQRIDAIEAELVELAYLEEALISASDEHERSYDAPPWAILGAEIVVDDTKTAA